MTAPNKIDSNITGLAFAEESALKTLPGSPIWYALEPNSYSDFGGKLSTVARAPINPTRQQQKGTITDLDTACGWNIDYTNNNLLRLLQGFFFADAFEKPDSAPFNGTQIPITSVVASTTNSYEAASGLGVFLAGQLVWATGFTNAGNNGLHVVQSSSATTVKSVSSLTAEASPPAAARIQVVGFQGGSGDLTMTVSSTSIVLGSTTLDFTTMSLNVGEWLFVGGDASGTFFATCPPFYGRIDSIAAHAISFSETTGAPVTDTGTGKTIQVFAGKSLQNSVNYTAIKRRSYNIERQLGNDGNGTQSEYIAGGIPNEFTLNVPQANKINADLTFVGLDSEFRDGTTGIKSGTRISAGAEAAYNTSSDVYRMRMSVVSTTLNNPALFAYLSDFKITLKNNVTPNKAIGVLGAFDASAGNFEVGGNVTAYFSTVAAVEAVRAYDDVSMNIVAANANAGFVFDIPLLGLGGGAIGVTKDQPITVPLDAAAAKNHNGYTFTYTNFPYLPNAAMPS